MLYILISTLLIISFLNPRIYISLLLFLAIITPGSHAQTDIFGFSFIGFNINLIDVLFLSLILSITIKIIVNKSNKIYYNDLTVKILPFLIYNLVCVLIGILLYDDISRSLYDSRVIFYYGIFLIKLKDFGFNLSIKNMVYVLFFGLFVYCFMVFSIFIFVESHPLFVYFEEGNSFTLGRLIFQQEFLFLLAFPLILGLITSHKINIKIKFILFILLITFSAKVFLSMSRGMIAFIILTILPFTIIKIKNHSLYLNKKVFFKNFKILFFGFIASVIIFIFVLPNLLDDSENVIRYFFTRFYGIFESDSSQWFDTHISNRLIMWKTGFNEVFKSFLFGHGYGYAFTIDHPEWSGIKLSFIDSTFITIMIRSGLIGLILYLRFYFRTLKESRKIYRFINDKESFNSIYYKSISISLIVLLLYSINNSLLVFSISIFPFLIILNLSLFRANYEE
jgi:hypothetical protein